MQNSKIKKVQKTPEVLFLRFKLVKVFTITSVNYLSIPGCSENYTAPFFTIKLINDIFNRLEEFKKLGLTNFGPAQGFKISLMVANDQVPFLSMNSRRQLSPVKTQNPSDSSKSSSQKTDDSPLDNTDLSS